jgi:hypothetical protein
MLSSKSKSIKWIKAILIIAYYALFIAFLASMKNICGYLDSSHFLVKVTCLFLIGFYQVSVLAMVFLGMPYVVEAIRPENSEILE